MRTVLDSRINAKENAGPVHTSQHRARMDFSSRGTKTSAGAILETTEGVWVWADHGSHKEITASAGILKCYLLPFCRTQPAEKEKHRECQGEGEGLYVTQVPQMVHVCVCSCVCVYVYMCIYIHKYTWRGMYAFVWIHLCMYTPTTKETRHTDTAHAGTMVIMNLTNRSMEFKKCTILSISLRFLKNQSSSALPGHRNLLLRL